MLTVGAITLALCWLHMSYGWFKFPSNSPTLGAISLVVGMLLVFRMNTAYDRWWEGRKLLGQLMNSSRFLSMKVDNYIDDRELKNTLEKVIISYAYAVAEHLQDSTSFKTTLEYLPESFKEGFDEAKHKPSFVLNLLSKKFLTLNKSGVISNEQLLTLEGCVSSFTDVVGACERIKFTPIPFAYAIHLKRIILLYCLMLPFTLIGDYGYWSAPVIMIIFFVLVGIEVISEEIEEPFGKDDNDLPIMETATNIKKNIDYLIV